MSVGPFVAQSERKNRYARHRTEGRTVRLFTSTDGHRHIAAFDEYGNGWTDAGPDGHRHRIHWLEVQERAGHRHELTTERAAPREDPGP